MMEMSRAIYETFRMNRTVLDLLKKKINISEKNNKSIANRKCN